MSHRRDYTNDLGLKIAKIFFLLMLIPFGLWLRALVLVDLWVWFAVPLGVMAIGKAHAYGLCVLFTMFEGYRHNPDEDNSMGAVIVGTVVFPLVVWFFGWLMKEFMV
jgi:hypothetical protein